MTYERFNPYPHAMESLIGRRVTAVEIDALAQEYIRFQTDQGPLCFLAEGDCCSQSWFYHVLGLDTLVGHVVTAVREVGMGEIEDGYSRQEVDQLYKVTLTTDAGYCDIEFRNSSNGYYGGMLAAVPEVGKRSDMQAITEDYTSA